MRYLVASLMVIAAACTSAQAQTATESRLLGRTATMQSEVVVRDDRGSQIRGRLVGLSGDELELITRGGPRRLSLSRVMRVTQPGDPVIDGVLRGMGVATGWCVLLACESTANGSVRPGDFVGRVAVGGLIGGAVDRAINGGRTIYRRQAPTIHIGVGPRQGAVTVTF
jgi:hypothetical protein